MHAESIASTVAAARIRGRAHGAIVAPASSCPRAEVLNSEFDAAECSEVTAPAVAIAVAAPPTPPTPLTSPKPRENTPSTPKTNGTVLHDFAGGGGESRADFADERGAGDDVSVDLPAAASLEPNAAVLKRPSNGHQIPIRIVPCAHYWAKCEGWQSRQAYRAYMRLGLLAEWADWAGSPNGADPWPFRVHRLDEPLGATSTKLHSGPRGPFRRLSARPWRHFDGLRSVVAQEAANVP